MNDTVARPGLAVLWRRVALVALSLVAVVQSSSVRGAQGGQTNEPFPRAARRALAHGRPAEAEALAKARPANDPAAAAVLGRLAINRGAYEDALKILEPAAAADPRSDAALELGLLSQRLGRNQQATRLLTALSRQVGPSADLETLFRAGRAAHALALPHDADAYFKAAAERGVDPAVQTEYGSMFLDIFYAADALKAFQAAVAADAQWAPGYAGVARTLADENPTAAAEAANKALAIDPTLADAHLTLAQMDLDSARYDAARERIDKVLAVNERDLEHARCSPRSLTCAPDARPSTSRRRRCWRSIPRLARCTASPPTSPRGTTGSTKRSRCRGKPSRSTHRTRGRMPISACS